MTRLPESTAPTTADFLAEAGPRLASLCTACGACFRACPIADHIGLAGADAGAVTLDLRRLARGEPATLPETLHWVGACAKSGLCIPASRYDVQAGGLANANEASIGRWDISEIRDYARLQSAQFRMAASKIGP